MLKPVALAVLLKSILFLGGQAVAGSEDIQKSSICGDPPPVTNETVKGEIEGRVSVLMRLLGDSGLKGTIDASRTEIFSKYQDGERTDAYFQYMFCNLIMSDPKTSGREKIREVERIYQHFTETSDLHSSESPADRSVNITDTRFHDNSVEVNIVQPDTGGAQSSSSTTNNVINSNEIIIGDDNKISK
ncbi:MAG: hypothetical protein AAFN27_18585 [Pseudomonadota bacterium]